MILVERLTNTDWFVEWQTYRTRVTEMMTQRQLSFNRQEFRHHGQIMNVLKLPPYEATVLPRFLDSQMKTRTAFGFVCFCGTRQKFKRSNLNSLKNIERLFVRTKALVLVFLSSKHTPVRARTHTQTNMHTPSHTLSLNLGGAACVLYIYYPGWHRW